MRTQPQGMLLQSTPPPTPPIQGFYLPSEVVVGTGLTIMVAIVSFLAKSYFDHRDTRDKVADERLVEFEKKLIEQDQKLSEFKLEVQRNFVERDHFVVAVAKVDATVQRLADQIYSNGLILQSLKERLSHGAD
jgi:hypothetical protein